MNGKVAILLGSESDRNTIESSVEYFKFFDISFEIKILSAHRNPAEVSKFANEARNNGYNILLSQM